jgi:hypothetical protein
MSSHSTPAPPPAPPAAPTLLDCDIVMKGGITSGVVYPRAITELAKSYRFRNVGGTSAGAIGAAAAAAAEYRRQQGCGHAGFAELDRLPTFLGGDSKGVQGSNLFALFQPERRTLPLFAVAAAALQEKGKAGKVVNAALTQFAGSAGLGALTGVVLGIAAGALTTGWGRVAALAAAVLLALVGAALGVVAGVVLSAVRELPANRFGLCSGTESPAYPAGTPALTPWLSELFNRIAGLPYPVVGAAAPAGGYRPLTIGDLWGTRTPRASHETELQLVTTNLTHGRPHRLPYDTTRLYFRPDELRELFPGWVVDWMVSRPRPPARKPDPGKPLPPPLPAGFAPLPAPADLPVVVAARLSLSFPFLISAVPLYAFDFSRERKEDRVLERCWFSDGGLCSNFPVHFFDHPLPAWPTFAINLRDEHPDHPVDLSDEQLNSVVVKDNRDGLNEWWNRFDRAESPLSRLGGFAGAMVFAAKDWHDNMQLAVPGYRDRVVHVSLSAVEGGLNLAMPPERIQHLGERGQLAAAKLAVRFSPHPGNTPITWDNHRWIRFRNTFRLIEEALREMHITLNATPANGHTSYRQLIHAKRLPSYRMGVAQRRECLEWVDRLLADDFLTQSRYSFSTLPPKPRPVLRVVPEI